MGTWGTALYSDDDASDLKEEYLMQLKKTQSHKTAMENCYAQFKTDNKGYDSPEDEAIFWFVIAERQWYYGALMPEVKAKALEYFARPEHLELWEEAGDKELAARKAVLDKLKDKIESPLPPVRNIPKLRCTPYDIGDVIAYQIKAVKAPLAWELDEEYYSKYIGKWFALRIVGKDYEYQTEHGDLYPIVQVYYWCGDKIPTLTDLEHVFVMPARAMESLNDEVYFDQKDKHFAFGLYMSTGKISNSLYIGTLHFNATNECGYRADTHSCSFLSLDSCVGYDRLQQINWDGKSVPTVEVPDFVKKDSGNN